MPFKYTSRHNILYILAFCISLLSCTKSSNDNSSQEPQIRRTIIAYIIADNNLNANFQSDVNEMITGSNDLPEDCRLVAYVDPSNGTPYIIEIKDGKREVLKNFNEFYSISADSMTNILQWIADKYPADEYALIIGGHGTGPLIENDTIKTTYFTKLYAYGPDETGSSAGTSTKKWLNIPSFATILSNIKDKKKNSELHFEYIFFDCCCMQTAEVAYELRNYTDYIIAPASETPANGAPYEHIVPLLGTDKELIGKSIIDNYITYTSWNGTGGIAISTVKTSEMEDLLDATHEALLSIREKKKANNEWSESGIWDGTQWVKDKITLNKKNCIYYYRKTILTSLSPILHDMKNIMRSNLSADTYEKWLTQFNKAIVYSYCPNGSNIPWLTALNIEFGLFTINEDTYGGMSMIIPSDIYDKDYDNLNSTMYGLEWANKVGWHELGW